MTFTMTFTYWFTFMCFITHAGWRGLNRHKDEGSMASLATPQCV